jgi:hypothetical protein
MQLCCVSDYLRALVFTGRTEAEVDRSGVPNQDSSLTQREAEGIAAPARGPEGRRYSTRCY